MLIKAPSADASSIRAFGTPARLSEPAHRAPSEAETLRERVGELQLEIAEAERRLPELLSKARKDAKREALDELERDETQRLELLKDGMDQALGQWTKSLESLDRLASDLSRSVLERVFGDDDQRTNLVTAALKRRLAQMESASLLGLRVSAADFPAGAALDRLKSALGTGIAVAADESLETGECAIDLKLGQIDAGPGAQWHRVRAFLDGLGEAAA